MTYAWEITSHVLAYESLTVSTVSIGITAATYQATTGNLLAAKRAIIQNRSLDSGAINYRVDGTAPTGSTGTELYPGDSVELDGIGAISQFRAIRKTGEPDAILLITTYS